MDGRQWYLVTGRAAWEAWMEERGMADEVERVNPDFDWQAWAMRDPEGYYMIRGLLREFAPDFFVTETVFDEKWWEDVTHDGPTCYDACTGEELPFIEWGADEPDQ